MARLPSIRVGAAFGVVALALLIALLLLVCTGGTAETPTGPRPNTARVAATAELTPSERQECPLGWRPSVGPVLAYSLWLAPGGAFDQG